MDAPNDESQSVQGNGIPETHSADDAIVTDEQAQRNRFAHLQARATKAGHHLQKVGSGFLVSRWGHVRHCVDLDGVEMFLRQVGALK